MKVKMLSSHEIGRPKARYKNPLVSGQLYKFRQPQYDIYMVTVATALTKQTLFQVIQGQPYTPAGGTAFTKSAWDTSMVQAGLFPNPDLFYAKQISLDARTDMFLADAQHVFWDSMVFFNISQRPFLSIAASKLPCAGGVFAFSSGNVNNGLPHQNNEFDFSDDLGEIVAQGQNFSVVIDPTLVHDAASNGVFTTTASNAGGAGVNVKCTLDGLYSRVVL